MCFTRSCSHHAAIGSSVMLKSVKIIPKGCSTNGSRFNARGTKGGISLLDSGTCIFLEQNLDIWPTPWNRNLSCKLWIDFPAQTWVEQISFL
jgi:hypothetical protein